MTVKDSRLPDERCETCASWKRLNSETPPLGECWSGDRLDGDMSKGPASYTRPFEICEAWLQRIAP